MQTWQSIDFDSELILFSSFFHLYSFLELQQLNDEILGYNSAKVLQSKQQGIINVAFSVWRCQDQLVRPEEGVKVRVMEVFLLAGTAVGSRPQLHWVSDELNGFESSSKNSHDCSRQQEHLERKYNFSNRDTSPSSG